MGRRVAQARGLALGLVYAKVSVYAKASVSAKVSVV